MEEIKSKNVSGEIKGSIKAIQYALENNYKYVEIYYDYYGISKWASGEWKRNNNMTKKYHEYVNDAKKTINIKFIKVKSHSNDKYNDLADKLARQVLEK